MAWDDTKIPTDDITSADWNAMVIDQKTRQKTVSGAGVPSSAPGSLGEIYVDTVNLKIYIATGTSSSSDYKKVLSQ